MPVHSMAQTARGGFDVACAAGVLPRPRRAVRPPGQAARSECYTFRGLTARGDSHSATHEIAAATLSTEGGLQ